MLNSAKRPIPQMGIDLEKLLTIEELADYLQVKRRTVYDWVKKGKIPAIKTVGQWRFKRDQIDQWLSEQG